jgi:hypothetical protein
MDSMSSLDANDLDKLNDKDKAELRQFITNEQQRSRIQSCVCRNISTSQDSAFVFD